jgi:peptide-methionine (S)-S-oxide reductase
METQSTKTAYLAGGCFWCLEAVFERIPGVVDVVSGYMGGAMQNPDYGMVGTGVTGHAETVRIDYDPAVVDFPGLLEVFWKIHDPTTRDRQGADSGSQYRSAIFYADAGQKAAAEASMAGAARRWDDPLVTELSPAATFWPAEDYHQDYFRKNPGQGYCRIVIAPKLKKAGL